MKKYRKLIVAVIGIGVLVSKDFLGTDICAQGTNISGLIINSLIGAATTFGIYQLPNKSTEVK